MDATRQHASRVQQYRTTWNIERQTRLEICRSVSACQWQSSFWGQQKDVKHQYIGAQPNVNKETNTTFDLRLFFRYKTIYCNISFNVSSPFLSISEHLKVGFCFRIRCRCLTLSVHVPSPKFSAEIDDPESISKQLEAFANGSWPAGSIHRKTHGKKKLVLRVGTSNPTWIGMIGLRVFF